MNGKILNIIKSLGAIGLAAILAFILYEVLTNDLTHIGEYMQDLNKTQLQQVEIMTKMESTIGANTLQMGRLEEVIRDLR